MLFGVGVYLRRLYLEAMRHRVERRFVPLVEEATGRLLYDPEDGHFVDSVAVTLVDAGSANDGKDQLAATVFQRFELGGAGAKLFLLREMGTGSLLSPRHVQGRKRVRNSQLQRLLSRSFSTRFG